MGAIRILPAIYTDIEYGDNTEWVRIVSYAELSRCFHLTTKDHNKNAYIFGPDRLKDRTFEEIRQKQHIRITCDWHEKYNCALWRNLFDCDPKTMSKTIIHNYHDEEKIMWDYSRVYIQDIKTGEKEYDAKKPRMICVSIDDDEYITFYAGFVTDGIFKEIELEDDSCEIADLFKMVGEKIDWGSLIEK